MDCRTALEILDVTRPDSYDLNDPELARAVEYLHSHPDCEREFRKRQSLDGEIGRLIRDVAVPIGLKDRLLVRLVDQRSADGLSEDRQPAEASAAIRKTVRLHRRSWFRWVVSAAASVAVVAWQFIQTDRPQLDLAALQKEAADALSRKRFARLNDFDSFDLANGLAVVVPDGWAVRLKTTAPKGYHGASTAGHTIAVFQFTFTSRGRLPVTGYLLAIPKTWVNAVPQRERFLEGKCDYVAPLIAVSWTMDDLVYVCLVPDEDARNSLEKLLTPRFG